MHSALVLSVYFLEKFSQLKNEYKEMYNKWYDICSYFYVSFILKTLKYFHTFIYGYFNFPLICDKSP